MPQHTIGATYRTDAGSIPLSATSYVVNDAIEAVFPVAAGAVNTPYLITFPHVKVHDYCLAVGTQTSAQVAQGAFSEAAAGQIEIKVNSTGSPVPDLTIVAKLPHAFAPCLVGTANEFSADVTEFFLSNPGIADLVLIVRIGLNL